MEVVHVVATRGGENIPELQARLPFMKSLYMLGGDIAWLRITEFRKGLLREWSYYVRRDHRKLAIRRYGASCYILKCFTLSKSDWEDGGGLWAAKVLLLLRTGVRGGYRITVLFFLQCIDVKDLINVANETLHFSYGIRILKWTTIWEEQIVLYSRDE